MRPALPRQIPDLSGLNLPGGVIEALRQVFQRLYDLRDSLAGTGTLAVIQDTHANRSLHSPGTVAEGSIYVETDRGNVVYIARQSLGTASWVFLGGTFFGTFANRPTDLGTNDVDFLYQTTDTYQEYKWSGTAWVEVTEGNLLQIAYATAGLALTGAFQDVTGATITLTRAGRHLITATFDFTFTAGDNGFNLVGQLVADGTAQAQQVNVQSTGNANFMASQQWSYTPASTGKVVKLQAKKLGGAGTSSANNPGTSISALWIGP